MVWLWNAGKGLLGLVGKAGGFLFGSAALGTAGVVADQTLNEGNLTDPFLNAAGQKIKEKGPGLLEGIEGLGGRVLDSTSTAAVEGKWAGIWANLQQIGLLFDRAFGPGGIGLQFANWARTALGGEEPLVWSGTGYVELSAPTDNTAPTPEAGGTTPSTTVPTPQNVSSTMPHGITTENEFTVSNLTQGVSDLANGDVDMLHKANVFAHGLTEGAVHVVNLVPHALDAVDSVAGWTYKLFTGKDNGYNDRNLSEDFHAWSMKNVDAAWTAVGGGPPELKTAWDRAIHFTGELVPAVVAGNVLATGAFASVATNPSTSTTLANVMTKTGIANVNGLASKTALATSANAAGLAAIPALD